MATRYSHSGSPPRSRRGLRAALRAAARGGRGAQNGRRPEAPEGRGTRNSRSRAARDNHPAPPYSRHAARTRLCLGGRICSAEGGGEPHAGFLPRRRACAGCLGPRSRGGPCRRCHLRKYSICCPKTVPGTAAAAVIWRGFGVLASWRERRRSG
eukprot:scaffold3282_cov101-Isochrysis_galbana.AAC.8